MGKIRVLVIDNSALMRRLICDALAGDPQIEIVGEAGDGIEALEAVERLRPGVLTLDVDMPRLDGLQVLRQLMRALPTPVVVVSGILRPEVVIAALQEGAVDFVPKPSGTMSIDLYKVHRELLDKVRLAAQVDIQALAVRTREARARGGRLTAPLRPLVPQASAGPGARRVIAIAASSGGPQALDVLIPALPADLPAAVAIVQHMPGGFTASLADRLHRRSMLAVTEARGGDVLRAGRAYVAPGGRHLRLARGSAGMCAVLDDGAPVRGLRPCANMLMGSVAELCGAAGLGVVLTGMGSDGAEGCLAIRAAGGRTIVQDEASSLIYGMPRAAAAYADRILPLEEIATELVRWARAG